MNTVDLSKYRKNSQGHLVPLEDIPEIKLQRDDLVRELVNQAVDYRVALEAFKLQAENDIEAHIELAADQFDVKLGSDKGNLSLSSLDGQYQVKISTERLIQFDENIEAAKKCMDDYLEKATQADKNLRKLLKSIFHVNDAGNLDAKKLLMLDKLDIDDDNWKKAMAIIQKAKDTSQTKRYMRFYQRVGKERKWAQISLNFSGIEVADDGEDSNG
ncbi:MAG: DUF3164 family protein [Methylovulum sp.]|nr:DUF3164 family protein [Methylovulum sp.]